MSKCANSIQDKVDVEVDVSSDATLAVSYMLPYNTRFDLYHDLNAYTTSQILCI